MDKEDKQIDLKNERLQFITAYVENGEFIHKIVFEDTTIILNDEQIERIRF